MRRADVSGFCTETIISRLNDMNRVPHKGEWRRSKVNCIPFRSRPIRTVYFGSETLSCLGPKIWELIPENFKTLESVASFKTEIKKWKPDSCPCRLCKNYIHQVGFV